MQVYITRGRICLTEVANEVVIRAGCDYLPTSGLYDIPLDTSTSIRPLKRYYRDFEPLSYGPLEVAAV